MAILLLRLAGPMQSWGTRSRFSERDTEREPTKSGVVGLLCAALGKPREEQPGDGFPLLAEMAQLRLGIRVDREGVLRRDFHTAGGGDWIDRDYGVRKASGAPGDTVISNRYFLADAVFIAGLEGDAKLLSRLDSALAAPVWPLFLGRKAFVPSEPIRLADVENSSQGTRPDGTLKEALQSVPWLARREDDIPKTMRFVMECVGDEAGNVRQDVPQSFVSSQRQHGIRRVREELIAFDKACKQEAKTCS